MSGRRAAVFLDRDGVLNHSAIRGGKPYAPRSLSEFRILEGVPDALARLKQAGFLLVVVTNQPDIGNGLVDPAVVVDMHAKLSASLPIDDIRCCPHTRNDNCGCRKPKPGMLLAAAQDFGIELTDSFMIGDRWGDVLTGNSAGCKASVLIGAGYGEAQCGARESFSAPDLAAAVEKLLNTNVIPSPSPERGMALVRQNSSF